MTRNERIAALKTAKSCLAMVDVGQIATKLLPQASVLCVDKSMDVRALALVLIESCLSSLRKYHEHTTQRIEDERKRQQSAGPKIADASSTTTESSAPTAQNCAELPSQKQQDSSWSSWSVLQGLSKTLESATISATTLAESPSVIPQAADENRPQAQSRRDDSDTSRIPVAPHSSGWEDDIADDDIAGDEDMDTDAGESALKEVIQEQEFSADISGQGWKDDSLDDLMNLDADDAVDEREMASMHSKGSTVSGTLQSPSILTLPKKATRSISDVSIESKDQLQSKAKKQVKAVKPVVKKLSSSKDDDNWDDF